MLTKASRVQTNGFPQPVSMPVSFVPELRKQQAPRVAPHPDSFSSSGSSSALSAASAVTELSDGPGHTVSIRLETDCCEKHTHLPVTVLRSDAPHSWNEKNAAMDDGKYNDSRVFFVFFCGQPPQSVYHCHLVGWGDGTRILNAICSTG